ncbi:hypothetical protein C5167_031156 [Papaver somniferum]|nr:hypothetical protein C5167_031156 [Papaver somniferum]
MEVEYRCLVCNVPAGTTSEIWPAKQRCTIGFVTFHKKEDMDAAINGTNLIGQTQLGVSVAERRGYAYLLAGGDDEQVVVVTKLAKTKVVVAFLSSPWETNQKNYMFTNQIWITIFRVMMFEG